MHHRQLFVPTRVEHPGVDIGAVNTIISQAWEALTAEEREQFCKQVCCCSALKSAAVQCSWCRLCRQRSIGIGNCMLLICSAAVAADQRWKDHMHKIKAHMQ
jgi:hypothetical protein